MILFTGRFLFVGFFFYFITLLAVCCVYRTVLCVHAHVHVNITAPNSFMLTIEEKDKSEKETIERWLSLGLNLLTRADSIDYDGRT